MSDFAQLISFKLDRKKRTTESVYFIQHNNRRTTLEQELTIKSDEYGEFTASVDMSDFPKLLTEREAALKMADWMQRLSIAIENHWGQP